MDNIKSKKTYEIKGDYFFDIVEMTVFSSVGLFVFLFPMIIDNEVVSLLYYLSDLIYLNHLNFVYVCLIVFISLVTIKLAIKKEKSLNDKLDIIIKVIALVFLLFLYFKGEVLFLEQGDLAYIFEERFYKISIYFPIGCIFLPCILEYGLLNIVDGCTQKIMKKIFKVSGKSVLIFVFFLIDSFLGFYIVYKLYKDGRLRLKESVNALLNYPILEISTIVYISSKLNLDFKIVTLFSILIFIISNIIIVRLLPIKNKSQKFFIKSDYKEKSYRKNKLKMSVISYLEHKKKKNIFRYIVEYLNDAINIIANVVPIMIVAFLFINLIVNSEIIIDLFAEIYNAFLKFIKIPNSYCIGKFMTLGFLNQVFAINSLNVYINATSRLILAVAIINQNISITTNIVFISKYASFISYRDIILVYIERILIVMILLSLGYCIYHA